MFLKNHTKGVEGALHINTGDPDSGEIISGLVKDPAVQTVRISNIPADILQAIDKLAARQHRSRSSFVRRELRRIVAEYQARIALRSLYGRN